MSARRYDPSAIREDAEHRATTSTRAPPAVKAAAVDVIRLKAGVLTDRALAVEIGVSHDDAADATGALLLEGRVRMTPDGTWSLTGRA